MAGTPLLLSWRVKLPILLVFFASAPLLVTTFWMLDQVQKTHEATTLESLEALASAKSEAVDQFTEDRVNEVERIAQLISEKVVRVRSASEQNRKAAAAQTTEALPELKDAEELPTPAAQTGGDEPAAGAPSPDPAAETDPAPEPPPKLDAALDDLRQQLGLILWDQQKFEELLVIAADGEVWASTFTEHEGTTARAIDYFEHGLGATFVQSVFMSPITRRLTMVVATPIRDPSAEVVGVLAARLNLSRFFRLINDVTGLGQSGDTIVAKREGDAILFMAPTRHDPEAALTREVPLKSEPESSLQSAVRGVSGSGRVDDYRDTCVYAAWQHIETLQWALQVNIDCTEALGPFSLARARVLQFSVAVALLALLAAYLAAGALVKPLRKLEDAAERISKGDVDVELDIRSPDEVGELAESFERMIAAIKFFRERATRGGDDDSLDEVKDRPTDPGSASANAHETNPSDKPR